ncbi:RNA polymerase sigma factor [Actinoplanes sp. NPDC049596]|uniref:RNA polymerase sigma factor n=1 Tax=unclassified Actinoplanes TaxID=2626549 RepID=UPI00343C4528
MKKGNLPNLDPESREWIAGLRADSGSYETVSRRLHADLLRVARSLVSRRAGEITGPEREDLAHQATADAMMTIIGKLDEFRGESRFTTWAHRFVELEVMHKASRHVWRNGPVPVETGQWPVASVAEDPLRAAESGAFMDAVQRALAEDLTGYQRSAFVALVLRGVSPHSFGQERGVSRNTIYKALFDARRKIRLRLTAEGFLGAGR